MSFDTTCLIIPMINSRIDNSYFFSWCLRSISQITNGESIFIKKSGIIYQNWFVTCAKFLRWLPVWFVILDVGLRYVHQKFSNTCQKKREIKKRKKTFFLLIRKKNKFQWSIKELFRWMILWLKILNGRKASFTLSACIYLDVSCS